MGVGWGDGGGRSGGMGCREKVSEEAGRRVAVREEKLAGKGIRLPEECEGMCVGSRPPRERVGALVGWAPGVVRSWGRQPFVDTQGVVLYNGCDFGLERSGRLA